MQKLSKISLILGIVIAILIVGGLIGILAGHSAAKNRVSQNNPAIVESPSLNTGPTGHSPNVVAAELVKNPDTEAIHPAKFPPGIVTNWEDKDWDAFNKSYWRELGV